MNNNFHFIHQKRNTEESLEWEWDGVAYGNEDDVLETLKGLDIFKIAQATKLIAKGKTIAIYNACDDNKRVIIAPTPRHFWQSFIIGDSEDCK